MRWSSAVATTGWSWGLGGYQTPVEGLYLGGSGSHPSGSVTGLPGRLSSRHVDRYLRKR